MAMYSDFVSVKRRYTRSVNLERDINIPDSIDGYIPTSRAIESLLRIIRSVAQPNSVRAWTLTGSYGTGKSAFAHFLTMLCGPREDATRNQAINILHSVDNKKEISKSIDRFISPRGFLRAIATAQREPIVNTITRALYNGASLFWDNASGRKPNAFHDINEMYHRVSKGKTVDPNQLLFVLKEINAVSKSGVLLIIDELGKNLEYSAQSQALDDLYLLQQIAELPAENNGANVFLLGLLHQSFVDYAHNLGIDQRKEWSKVQGRFEDIPFIESSDRMIQLIGSAIKKTNDIVIRDRVSKWAESWAGILQKHDSLNLIDENSISSVYPLHPLAAIALPVLCSKFSQNDRTLFSFLASEEPNSFTSFIKETPYNDDHSSCLKLHHLYDYFVETANISFSIRPQFQKWVEVHSRILDAKNLEPEYQALLKTIGILNLISTTGNLKASRSTVSLAMCEDPTNSDEYKQLQQLIEDLISKGFITWRKQIDELRIWEGSDFDIEIEIQKQSQFINIGLAKLLNEYFPLKPLIAQRHSYQTGTLRYFERKYYDDISRLKEVSCENGDSDGLVIYWLGSVKEFKKIDGVPKYTDDGRPVVVICATGIKALQNACYEHTALKRIENNSKQLQSDGVAKREVSQRSLYAERVLEETICHTFDITSQRVLCYCFGDKVKYKSWSSFQGDLSAMLDKTYSKSLKLWNELINRRELTSQGAAARHKLIVAMIENEGQERLGIVGNGPEYSIFESMLYNTGIYCQDETRWAFMAPPNDNMSILNVWKAIETFCKSATDAPQNIRDLYEKISKPPYGVKDGPIPILLLAILQYYSEYISIYLDGNFVPVLGSEHFELLYRKPERFAVKHFNISGLKAQLFHELESVFSNNKTGNTSKLRNKTVLSVVKPIIGFVRQLPEYTVKTKDALSEMSIKVREAVLNAREPDNLLFDALPKACGLENIDVEDDSSDRKIIKQFRTNLANSLKELQTAYEILLGDCKDLIYKAFKVRSDVHKIREDLRVRASYLYGQVIEDQLKRFIQAAINENDSESVWLETIVMVIADKPARVWKDKDRIVFESKLYDIARRFGNLESLQKEMARDIRTGYMARRITVTKPDGKDLSHVVWLDVEQIQKIKDIAEDIYKDNEELIDALAAILVEKAIKSKEKPALKKLGQEDKVQKIGSK